jgi:hypothetical protein
MTDAEFDAVLQNRLKKIGEILGLKAQEYARGDRLSNFKKAAVAMSGTPAQTCVAFWMKHVISICDLANDGAMGRMASVAMWEEKIGDSINYLVLLEAIVKEGL